MFVQLWMTTDLVVTEKDSTIADAGLLFTQHRIRRIPVVDENGMLVGILTKDDITRALPSIIDPTKDASERVLAAQARVTSFMTENPIIAAPADPLEKVARAMLRNKVGGIPVVKEEKLVGIITESDIFRAFIEIMGGEDGETRLELTIDNSREPFFDVMEIFDDHDITVRGINLYTNYSPKQQLLIVRIVGDDIETAIDALWDGGFKVNSVIVQ